MPAFILLAIMCVCLAVISCLPSHAEAYTSLPMVALWGAIVLVALIYIFSRKRRLKGALLLLHLSMVVILCGALVTWLWGSTDSLHLRVGEPIEHNGHSISLVDFTIDYYPGTRAPRDFVSTITVDNGDAHTVSMNNILNINGMRLYQSAYDPDMKGTVLNVNHDPWGVGITYTGYIMLGFSMLIYLLRKRRNVVMTTALLVCLGASAAPRTIPREIAEPLGKVYIYNNGHITTVENYARDFAVKVCGSDTYKGCDAVQILAGWLFDYEAWKTEPCIKVRGKAARVALAPKGERIALADFFAPDGTYLAEGMDYREANEQFALISAAATGSLWQIFPVAVGDGIDWLSPNDSRAADMPLEQWHFTRHCMGYLAELIALDRRQDAVEVIDKIIKYQRREAGEALPGDMQTCCEGLYVSLADSAVPAVLLVLAGVLTFIFKWRRIALVSACVGVLWLAFIIAINWIASGSVPMSNGYETMQWMALASLLAGIAMYRRSHITSLCCVAGALAMMVAMMGHGNPQITPLMPVLRSPLLSVHVLCVMLAYAAMAIMAMCGIAWLIRRDADILHTARRLMMPAVFLIAAGIFIGAVWANNSWGRYWGWDPKEVWALITMLIYSMGLHGVTLKCFRSDRFFAIFCIVAFASVLMTYVGVNFILGGLHSYA